MVVYKEQHDTMVVFKERHDRMDVCKERHDTMIVYKEQLVIEEEFAKDRRYLAAKMSTNLFKQNSNDGLLKKRVPKHREVMRRNVQ